MDCHTTITTFPHPEVTASSPRDFSLELYPICQNCHNEQYQKVLDSVHQTALAAGNTNAAVCTDCHNPHTQSRLTDKQTGELLLSARIGIPQTCAKCHNSIYETYSKSVHGSALVQAGNEDVPTCIDCHGVHNISDPTSNTFRNSTPSLCAKCHTDETIMNKYGISTNVLDTYVADFHGTTVKMFEENFPDQPTNKPVCTDCWRSRLCDPMTLSWNCYQTICLGKCQGSPMRQTASSPIHGCNLIAHPADVPWFIRNLSIILIPSVIGGRSSM